MPESRLNQTFLISWRHYTHFFLESPHTNMEGIPHLQKPLNNSLTDSQKTAWRARPPLPQLAHRACLQGRPQSHACSGYAGKGRGKDGSEGEHVWRWAVGVYILQPVVYPLPSYTLKIAIVKIFSFMKPSVALDPPLQRWSSEFSVSQNVSSSCC